MSNDLWRFAQHLYAQPGVEAICLRLQNEGADICLLLCGAWLDHRGVTCNTARLSTLATLATPWQDSVVAPLRQVRQQWRAQACLDIELQGLRERIKQLELDAERELLQRLETLSQAWIDDRAPRLGDSWLQTLVQNRDALTSLRAATESL